MMGDEHEYEFPIQKTFFQVDALNETITSSNDLTIQQRFEIYHTLNPKVYIALRNLALGLAQKGRKRIGIKMLIEILRWNYMMQTDDPNSEFKISNDYTSRYARLLMECEPILKDIFQIKELKS